jgi:adenine/guanine phosphoribosyltransferase-like PRPP-binding protein
MSADNWDILHITDFHLNDPKGGTEQLRIKGHKEYLRGLCEEIEKVGRTPQCIVATGDFVDWHKVENYPHARAILDFLCSRFSLDRQKHVAVCQGNHDFIWALDKADQAGSRKDFRTFSEQFANGSGIMGADDRACLATIGDHISCLSIDSTFGCLGEDRPGDLPVTAADTIVEMIEEIPLQDLLIVATHYPVVTFESIAPYTGSEPNYYERHLWRSGQGLRDRVRKLRRGGRTLWLCGDTHYSDHIKIDDVYFIMTGRLGTQSTKPSQARRQAKCLRLSRSTNDTSVATFTFDPPGHVDVPDVGQWKAEESTVLELRRTDSGNVGPSASEPPIVGPKIVCRKVEVFNASLQDQILATISQRGLYRLGRYRTAIEAVSLSWVSIGPLMNEPGVFALTVDRMADWVKRMCESGASLCDSILLGLDSWGAILASQLSVLLGISNCSCITRTRGEHYSPTERLSESLLANLRRHERVILISDVVATGSSIKYVYDLIYTASEHVPAEWIAASVLCDPTQECFTETSFLSAQGAACTNLKMPLLRSTSLPDEAVLRPAISVIDLVPPLSSPIA